MKGNTVLIVGALLVVAGGAYLYSSGMLGGAEKFGPPLATAQPNLNHTTNPVAGGIRNILGPGLDFTKFGVP